MSAGIGTDLDHAAKVLREGGLVSFPTETVYGLGGVATNETAVAKIFSAKQRPHFDPLIVHVADFSQLEPFVAEWSELAERLRSEFWPGPLTLVVPRTDAIPDLVSSGLPTVAVRIPDHPIARELLARAGQPVAAPSANPFGRISPTMAQHVVDGLGESVDYVVDGGPCRVGLESTVVSLVDDVPLVLRPGGIALEDLQQVVPEIRRFVPRDDSVESNPTAPGMLERHYAPSTPLVIVNSVAKVSRDLTRREGLLCAVPCDHADEFSEVEILSQDGDLVKCAAGFFAALRRLDAAELDQIVAVRFPNERLGVALNDRLKRAAVRE